MHCVELWSVCRQSTEEIPGIYWFHPFSPADQNVWIWDGSSGSALFDIVFFYLSGWVFESYLHQLTRPTSLKVLRVQLRNSRVERIKSGINENNCLPACWKSKLPRTETYTNYALLYSLVVFGKTGLNKQQKPRSDVTESGTWSLFAIH